MTPEQFKNLPKFAQEYIKKLIAERDHANSRIERLELYIKGMYPEGTNTYINTRPDKTPLPNNSDILFDNGEVRFSVRFHANGELEIYDNNFGGKEMLIKPMVSNRITIRSV